MEDPGVIDTRIRTGEIRQEDTRITCQGSRLHLEDVIGHVPGRDGSLSRVYAFDGVPMQAEAYRRGDDLAVTVTQGQQA